MNWQPVTEGLGLGGYAAWEAAVEAAEGGEAHLVPIFLRFRDPGGGMSLEGAIAATQARTDVELSRHERDLLETERLRAGAGWPHEVRAVVYGPRALALAPPAYWEVLGVGPGFVPNEDYRNEPARDLVAAPGELASDVPVVAVIDEGIAFLNRRFRRAEKETRFLGLWLQAGERRQVQNTTAPWGDIRLGRVLTQAEIDGHLDSRLEEAEIYADVHRSLLPVTERSATLQRVAHGTHVLDIAAGAEAGEAMAAVPILAVQLPPSSMRETSGRRMEAHLVQGLRWVLAELLRQSAPGQVPPLVLNLSIGSLAGPGDGSEFLSDWLRFEIARHQRMAPGAEVRVTAAYGNARLWRLAARDEVRGKRPMQLDWRIQPDDRTASYLELWADCTMSGGPTLVVEPPATSGLPALTLAWPTAMPVSMRLDGLKGPVAAVHVAKVGGQVLLHLSVAPTVSDFGHSVAPAGLWRVTVQAGKVEPVRVVARVQRDDTPPGHKPLGRQSWLDHPDSWNWEDEFRSYTAPRSALGPQGPVTREGTAVAHAGAASAAVLLVGAARPELGQPGRWLPAAFSSEGAVTLLRPGESPGPSLSAQGEGTPFQPGILASGVLSGSKARLSGTSMAAPAVARWLLAELLAGGAARPVGQMPLAAAGPLSRIGAGVLA